LLFERDGSVANDPELTLACEIRLREHYAATKNRTSKGAGFDLCQCRAQIGALVENNSK